MSILMTLSMAFAGNLSPKLSEPKPAKAVGQDQDLGVPLNTRVSDRSLLDLSGKAAPLLGGSRKVLVVFYKGGWCPFCNGQLRDLALNHDEFVSRGIDMVAVSSDTPEASLVTQATWKIPFRVLSDPEGEAIEEFQIGDRLGGMTRGMLKVVAGIDQPAWRGSSDGETSLSGTFLVQDGVVTWKHVESALKVRPSAQQLLEALPDDRR